MKKAYSVKVWIKKLCKNFVKLTHLLLNYTEPVFTKNCTVHISCKNFVKVTFLLKKLLKVDLTKYFFGEKEILVFPHCTVWKNEKFSAKEIFFPSNQFRVKFFSKKVI